MSVSQNTKLGIIALLGSSFLFSTGTTSRALLDFPGTPIGIAAWRIFIGGIGILVFLLIKYGKSPLIKLVKLPLIWVIGSFTFLFQIAMFYAAAELGVALATLIAIGSSTFLSGFFAWIFKFGKPTKIWLVSTVLAIVGLTLLTGFNGEISTLGLVAVFSSGVMVALYVVSGAHLVRQHNVSGVMVITFTVVIGAIIAAPFALTSTSWISKTSDVLLILYLGLGTTTFGNVFYGLGIHNLAPGTVTTLSLIEPVLATTWGVVLLNETMTSQGWVGCAIILGALTLLANSESKQARAKSGDEVMTLA